MNARIITGIYAMAVAISMFFIWNLFFITGSVPLYDERPLEIIFHIAAETMTMLTLLAGGIGLLKNTRWGLNMYFIGVGMLAYALVNSPGMYVQTGQTLMVAVFPVSFVFAVIFAVVPFVKKDSFKPGE